MNLQGKLTDKVAIITGAGRGIGQASALGLAAVGAHVVLAARSQDQLDATVAEIRKRNGAGSKQKALGMVCDVADEAQVAEVVRRTLTEFGRIDVMVNSAGYCKLGDILGLTVAEFNTHLNVNLIGTFLFSKAVLPTMMQQRSGNIINVVSGAGKRGFSDYAAYASAKFAVIGFSECLQMEAKEYGISVCSVCPGPVRTFMRAQNIPDEDLSIILEPEELGDAIVFAATRGPLTVIPELPVNARAFVSF